MGKPIELDEVKSIDALKKELAALKRENKAYQLTIDKVLRDLSKKTEEVEHLQTMIKDMVPIISKETKAAVEIMVTAEQQIAEIQLERLRESALQRPLTFEETRIYDILVKNKRLAQDQSTINLNKADYRDVTNTDLMQIVGKAPSDESGNS